MALRKSPLEKESIHRIRQYLLATEVEGLTRELKIVIG
jgi:hypothetical protein